MTQKDRVWMWLAWRLPRRLVYMAAVRLWSYATTGKYAGVESPTVGLVESLKAWDE
jgi:hypothetical protein